jgi:hypothetical protein
LWREIPRIPPPPAFNSIRRAATFSQLVGGGGRSSQFDDLRLVRDFYDAVKLVKFGVFGKRKLEKFWEKGSFLMWERCFGCEKF